MTASKIPKNGNFDVRKSYKIWTWYNYTSWRSTKNKITRVNCIVDDDQDIVVSDLLKIIKIDVLATGSNAHGISAYLNQ